MPLAETVSAGSGFSPGIGILMSVVMQSSSAAAATTLVALNAGSLTFDQACAMIVGQSVGTAATSAMVAIGAGLAVRRAALAHIVYNVSVGTHWDPVARTDRSEPLAGSVLNWTIPMECWPWRHSAAFSNLSGSLRSIRGLIVSRASSRGFLGTGSGTAVSRLDPILADAGGAVALEAAWRATLELAHGSVDAFRRRLIGESVQYDPPVEATRQTEQFLESLSLETLDLGTFEPRLVRLCHALDHLNQLHEDLRQIPSDVSGWRPPPGFEAGARALAAWLDATKDPEAAPSPAILKAIADASKRLTDDRKTARDKMLKSVALQRNARRDGPQRDSTCSDGRTPRFTTHGV